MNRALRAAAATAAAVLLLLLPLAIPPADAVVLVAPLDARPFIWANDSGWQALEARFAAVRPVACGDSTRAASAIAALDRRIAQAGTRALAPSDTALGALEAAYFALAPDAAACAALAERYVATAAHLRAMVKRQSVAWDFGSRDARDRLYRLLYGGRAAAEEVMLQHGGSVPTLVRGLDEPSATPAAESNGITLHSGDILVSRGGYPTSALIARGNDYPGNFSHIALVHIDSATHAISVIEAHIELGVAITTADGYLADKKLRVMVLRPRADLPALVADPMLPHKAATAMLARARGGHIPYDFAMDHTDASRLFCSEVASQAYRAEGLPLWMGISTISRPGLRSWLASFGVQHFATQEPSDIEYDPQMTVVAEWRDAASLMADHVDNAVTDAMLEGADRGERLAYPWYQLPVARLLKGWSWVRQLAGGTGPIPEGMAPAAALRNRGFGARHAALAEGVTRAAAAWRAQNGYAPPYWVLLELARTAAAPR